MMRSRKTAAFAAILMLAFLAIPSTQAGYLGWRIFGGRPASGETAAEDVSLQNLDEPLQETNKEVRQTRTIGHKLLWYFPDRFMDLLDCFTLEVGIGEIGADVYLTRWASFGSGIGYSATAGWTAGRQYGVYTHQGWNGELFKWTAYEMYRERLCGNYKESRDAHVGAADIEKLKLEIGADPYAIGAKAAAYVSVKFLLHPVELADFVCGLFLIDFQEDDK